MIVGFFGPLSKERLRRMNWRMLTISLFIVGSPGWGLDATGAEPPADAASAPEFSPSDIQGWVADLDSDQFADRESATKQLIDARRLAIGPVVVAMAENRREIIARGAYVLEALAQCGDRATEEAAQSALESLAAGSNALAARRAIASLDELELTRQRRAIKALSWLGAKFQLLPDPLRGRSPQLRQRPVSISIDHRWTGSEEHLVHLKSLVDVQRVVFRGPQVVDTWLESIKSLPRLVSVSIVHADISDQGVAHLTEIESLRRLNVCYTPIGDGSVEYLQRLENVQSLVIYGSNITSQGTTALRERLVRTSLDVKNGAFLGVGADPNGQRCQINTVRRASAAERAGLQVKDILTHYAGKEVENFTMLRELIGHNRSGDAVEVKIQRGTQQMTKRIVLGEWDDSQLPQ